jgi:signal transduction histidine kinase
VENGTLHLSVSDDGPGMSHPPARPGMGTGLRNTRERLAELCGPGEHLSIVRRNGTGTTVRIAIPAVREGEAGRG